MKHQDRPEDTDFDLRARAELALAFEPGEPPTHLLRHTPWYARRGLHALCAAVMVGSVAAGSVLSLRARAWDDAGQSGLSGWSGISVY